MLREERGNTHAAVIYFFHIAKIALFRSARKAAPLGVLHSLCLSYALTRRIANFRRNETRGRRIMDLIIIKME